MISILAIVAVLAGAQNTASPSTAALPEPRQISEEAMKYVVDNDIKHLFELLTRHMPMKPAELEGIRTKMVDARKPMTERVGKVLGYTFISECRKSDILVRYTYAEKREKSVVRWQFIFYKPRTTWMLTYFFMDEDLNALFQPCV